jgi:HK97 family phage major capsid protein
MPTGVSAIAAQIETLKREREHMYQSNQEKRSELIRRANGLLESKPFTKENKSQFDSFMTLADALQDAPEVSITEENRSTKQQASQEFRAMLMHGDKTYRTYSGLDIPSPLVANEFEARLVEAQKAAGPLFAGSPALTNLTFATNGPLKLPIVDDTTSTGYLQADQTASTEAELATVSSVSLTTKTFSSGIVLASNELLQDVSSRTTLENLLYSSLSKRISRIQNSTFLPSLITSLAANSSASVASETAGVVDYNDLIVLTGQVNAQYRFSPSAAFLFSSVTQTAIAKFKDSQSRPLFAEVMASRPTLLGYPVYISDYADTAAVGKNPILFGDFSYVFTRSMPGYDLQVLKEQFAANGFTGVILRKRTDLQYAVPITADSAIKMLHT